MWILHTCPCTCVSCIDDNKYPTCRNSGAFHHSHIMATEKQCFHTDQGNVKTSVSFLIPWKVIIQHLHQNIVWQKGITCMYNFFNIGYTTGIFHVFKYQTHLWCRCWITCHGYCMLNKMDDIFGQFLMFQVLLIRLLHKFYKNHDKVQMYSVSENPSLPCTDK